MGRNLLLGLFEITGTYHRMSNGDQHRVSRKNNAGNPQSKSTKDGYNKNTNY